MLVNFSIISEDVLLDRIDGTCYKHEFTIDRYQMENDGWKESEYDVKITIGDSAPGAHPHSYSKLVTFTALDEYANQKEDSVLVWVNFIPTI